MVPDWRSRFQIDGLGSRSAATNFASFAFGLPPSMQSQSSGGLVRTSNAAYAMFIFYWMKESFINQNVGVETKMRFKNVIYTNLNRPTVPSGPF